MSSRYRVLALDQRGHGETQWAPPTAYDTSEMVADVEAFVTALGLEQLRAAGLVDGRTRFDRVRRQTSARTRKLVIVDIAPEIDVEGLKRIQAGVVRSDVFDSVDEAYARARTDNPIPPDDQLRHRVEYSLMRRDDGKFTYRYDRALRDPTNPRKGIPPEEGWRLVANINVPTLLVRGEVQRHPVEADGAANGKGDSELPSGRSGRIRTPGPARQTRCVPRCGCDVSVNVRAG